MNRPELQRMLNDAKMEKLDCVMVYKTNRLARNTSDLLTIVEELHRQNVEFLACLNAWKSKFNRQVNAPDTCKFSGFERNTILENIYTGQRQRALEGYYQGNLPLGYNNIPDNKKN